MNSSVGTLKESNNGVIGYHHQSHWNGETNNRYFQLVHRDHGLAAHVPTRILIDLLSQVPPDKFTHKHNTGYGDQNDRSGVPIKPAYLR